MRRSQLIGTYGPGAIIDLRAPLTGAPVSGLLAGLEGWDEATSQKGLSHRQVIKEPRLQKKFSVNGFRLPPVRPTDDHESSEDVLPVIRFPEWLQCAHCGRLARDGWQFDPGDPSRRCAKCSTVSSPVFAAPVRFVVACAAGHLDEFPWKLWAGCRCEWSDMKLYLETTGPGLRGKLVGCKTCGQKQSFDGVFSKKALTNRHLKCRGREPWLHDGDRDSECKKSPRVLQRGASNLYWSITPSAIDIPPFSNGTPSEFGEHWETVLKLEPALRAQVIEALKLPESSGKPLPVLLKIVEVWSTALAGGDSADEPLQWAEYQQFVRAEHDKVDEKNFKAEREPVPADLRQVFDSIILASRLREVRATVGFTRIQPPSGPFKDADNENARIYVTKPDWLPGIELLGEGIFLRFNQKRLNTWEESKAVAARVEELRERISADLFEEEPFPSHVTSRFVLIHSFAHALMLQLSLDCGYGSSALRERLYVGTGPNEMSGVLIHTGAADSEGTLGGLVRQGRGAALARLVPAAIERMKWCSSDPVCITNTLTLSSPRSGAACHSCLLMPETSCEHFNRYLDRGFLVGTPKEPKLGWFNGVFSDG